MKKQSLILLVTLAAMLFGLGRLALAQSVVVAQVPGNTVVQDPAGDLLLRNCDKTNPNEPCSLPPKAPLDLPGYFDIKTAKITEIGGGLVDLFIALYEPIPAEPPEPFVAYFWQFEGGCAVPNLGVNKDGIRVVWHGDTQTWSANWFVITQCTPTREIHFGDPVPFQFTEDGVKVRVLLSDVLTAIDLNEPLVWHAGVRRVPFVYTLPDGTEITHTVAVDYAPDVIAFNPAPPPALIHPEDPATWVPR